jgi:hypothetical protein
VVVILVGVVSPVRTILNIITAAVVVAVTGEPPYSMNTAAKTSAAAAAAAVAVAVSGTT